MNDTALFAATARPDSALRYRRDDPHDPRLGELVAADPAEYAAAQVVILGCPQDEGVRRNRGRPGAAGGPAAIRAALYKLGVAGLEGLRLFDLGDTRIQPDLEATHELHRALVRRVIADGKTLVALGGGNDISFPDCAGLADAAGPTLAINVDAHYDVRADTPRNSGTPYRQLLEGGHVAPGHFVELGGQPFANSAAYGRYLAERGARAFSLRQARAAGLAALVREILEAEAASVFWGVDMDVVRAADAPGVSAPNPLGMSGEELCLLAELAGAEPRSRLLEVSELNPAHDIDGRTARLAAVAIWSFLIGRG
ncbi:formimidoylglutamase [Oscillochloris sp. ZM17-4]|uniref:formimidoylglutamase n=1 Tax=Oscillochloris sp. ZM17-4 TaxID=2866714 RepID=UPI001C73ACF6|nr:formimidoylglutamase [Oscillochloris sp. ZM17-4]MBX0326264.1 formimidoylglutamase [Oscillochloris sp. ZM17-4]